MRSASVSSTCYGSAYTIRTHNNVLLVRPVVRGGGDFTNHYDFIVHTQLSSVQLQRDAQHIW